MVQLSCFYCKVLGLRVGLFGAVLYCGGPCSEMPVQPTLYVDMYI